MNIEKYDWLINDSSISVERLKSIREDIHYFLSSRDLLENFDSALRIIEINLKKLNMDSRLGAIGQYIMEVFGGNHQLADINLELYDELVDKNFHHEARILKTEPYNILHHMQEINNASIR